MYKEYYGFKNLPFSIVADPDFVYETENFHKGYVYLVYGMEKGGGLIVISGEIGSGKTTLCKKLIKETIAKDNKIKIATIYNPIVPEKEILKEVSKVFVKGSSRIKKKKNPLILTPIIRQMT